MLKKQNYLKAIFVIVVLFYGTAIGQTNIDCSKYWFLNKSGIAIQKVFDKYVELPPIDSFYCLSEKKEFDVPSLLRFYNSQYEKNIGEPCQVSSRAFYYRLKGDSVFQNVHIATFFYYPEKFGKVKTYFKSKLNKIGTFKSKVLERYRVLFKDSMVIIISSFSYYSFENENSLFNVYYRQIRDKLATE